MAAGCMRRFNRLNWQRFIWLNLLLESGEVRPGDGGFDSRAG
jgi:hypothetical protein